MSCTCPSCQFACWRSQLPRITARTRASERTKPEPQPENRAQNLIIRQESERVIKMSRAIGNESGTGNEEGEGHVLSYTGLYNK